MVWKTVCSTVSHKYTHIGAADLEDLGNNL